MTSSGNCERSLMPWRRKWTPGFRPTLRSVSSAAAIRGSRRLSPELRVPSPEHAFEFVVQDLGPGLQQQMGTFRRPVHLLFLDEPAAHHLINGGFDKRCADRLALPVSFAEVRNELLVV